MANSWQKAYSELTDFIAEHSAVEIEASRVRLLDDVRPEFYRLFDDVRNTFTEEKFSALLNEATPLSTNYLKVEQEIVRLLGLEDVLMEADPLRFLHDPIDQLIRGLFDPLFDLLKGKIDAETFEATSSRNIRTSFGPLYRLGYEKWVALSLVRLLEADKSFQVTPPEFTLYDAEKAESLIAEWVWAPEGSNHILFKYDPKPALMVPDLVVHSAKVNRYIALRSQIGEAIGMSTVFSEKREWLPVSSVRALGSGLTLIYVADNPEEISLVADVDKICRPDLVIECREQKDWYYKREALEKVKLHHDSLKPRLGTYMVSRELVPEQELNSQEEDIHILTVGFDQFKLEPIISALQPESKD